jgi:16S rRNA (guanine966-N2)-methyltransferase
MSDRVRGSLFSIINEKLKDADVLDAFAGTGALGIESISRGSKSVIFIESDRMANQVLTNNIEYLGIGNKTKTIQAGVSAWATNNQDKRFDIIFADPPYDDLQLSSVSNLFVLLKPAGVLILSHPKKIVLPKFDGIIAADSRAYGTAALTFLRSE